MSLTITGTVVDESGNGLAGLLVEARGDWLLTSEVIKETTTGAGGGFTLVLPILAGQPPPPSTCRVRVLDRVGRPVCDDRDVSTVGGDQDLGRITVRDADRTGLLVTNGKGEARMVSDGNAMAVLIDGLEAFGQVAFDLEQMATKHVVMTQLFFKIPPKFETEPEKEEPELVFAFGSALEPKEPLPLGQDPVPVSRPDDKRPELLLLDASGREITLRILLNKPVIGWPEAGLMLAGLGLAGLGLSAEIAVLVLAATGLWIGLAVIALLAYLWFLAVRKIRNVLDDASHAEELREYLELGSARIPPPRGEVTVRGFEQPAPNNGVLHTKMVIIDGQRATVLGSPFEQYYVTDQLHMIDDPHRGDSTSGLVHDVSLGLHGPVVADLYETFRTYWNEDQTPGNQVPSLPADQVAPAQPAGMDGVIRAQVVRTLSAGRFSALDGISEKGILEGYLRAFASARRFIYLENQYFTDELITDGLKRALRGNDKLELIFMLNIRPDVPFYPGRQARLIAQIREVAPTRVGVFTRWSYDHDHPRPWVAPVYLHSKLGLVDDTWASVGSANLDGLSLDRNTVLSPLIVGETTAAELNINILDGQTGVTQMMPVERIRRRLWAEHLGFLGADLLPDPTDPRLADTATTKWLPLWQQAASAALDHVKAGRPAPLPGFVLRYPEDAGGLKTPRKHLTELGVPLDLAAPKVRPVGVTRAFEFFTGRWKEPNREDFIGASPGGAAVTVERTLLAGLAIPLTMVGTLARLPDGPRKLLGVLGWSLPPGVDDIGLAGLALGDVGERLSAWTELAADPEADEGTTAAALAELAIAVGVAVVELSRVELTAPQDYLDRTGIVEDFLPRLLDLFLIQSAAVAAPAGFDVARLLGLVEVRREPADPARFQVAHLRHVVHWDRFGTLVTDPGSLPRDVYGWGTAGYDAGALVANLGAVLQHLAIGVRRRELGPLPLMRLHGGPPPAHPPVPQVFLPLVGADLAGSGEAGLTVFGLPPTTAGGLDGGLGLAPYARGTAELRVPLSTRTSIGLAASGDLGSGIALVLRPDTDPALRTGLNEEAPGDGPTGAGITVDLTFAAPDGTDPVSLLAEDDLTLTGRSFAAAVRVLVDDDGVEAVVRFTVTEGRLAVTATGLPFLDALLPDDGLTADFDVDLAWSSRHGLRLGGQASLSLARIVARRVGPLTIDQVDLGLGAADGGLAASAGIAATLALGPVDLSVTGVGVRATIGPGPGNLGAGQLSVRLSPPTGIGVTIDAEVVTGGGFVAKEASGDYVGALELQLGRIGVKAIGVFSPGRDWSMLVLLYARIPPVQIGFGFTLDGIGGLVGLQRGVDVAGLASGMKSGAFDDLLFPPDPVRDATRIIARLRTLFPPRPRCLTIGPMVDVHWGKPVIITARLAVLLQLDDALGGGPLKLTRIVVVGQLRVAVGPTEQDPDARVLLLIIDVLGFWDLAERRYGFLAALRDSSVAGIDLTGSLAVWGEYGDHPRFLLAAGGFNSRFKDVPAQLAGVLDRLSGSFSVGRFDFALAGYFAVTPATIQAGLNLSATAKIGPVGLHGEIDLEVLVYRRPRTHFIFDFRIVAEVTYRGRSLAGVKVAGTIEGPGRWHVTGKVTFSILWWDISKSFDESWGTPPPKLTERVDVSALLAAELAKPENWSAEPPVGSSAMVSLAPRRGELTVRAHPLGRFVFAQQVAPFGLTLEKFGDADVAGTDHFEIEATLGGLPVAEAAPGTDTRTVREHFARAQFIEMDEEDRMTKPAYEELDAGLAFSSGAFEVSDDPVRAELAYETSYLDLETGEIRPEPSPTLPTAGLVHDLLQQLGRFGAAGRAPERLAEQAGAVRLALAVTEPQIVAADRDTLDAVDVGGGASTAQMIVEQRVRRLGRTGTQTVESFELVRT